MNEDQGIYAQDSWTLGRFTINPGVRFEHFNGSIGARGVERRAVSCRRDSSTRGPTCRTGTTSSPRFGFAWDIQGNGKTAVKFGIGKYVRAYSTGFAETYDPNFYSSATLTWNDLNKDDIGARHASGGCACYLTAGCEIDFSTLPATFGIEADAEPGAEDFASVSDRDQRQRAARDRLRHLRHRQLFPSRLQEPDLVRQPRHRSVGLHAVPRCRARAGETVTIYNLNPAKASALEHPRRQLVEQLPQVHAATT